MITALGERFGALSARYLPDPLVIVALLTLATALAGLLVGDALASASALERVDALARGWYAEATAPALMKFALQMCLVLATGHALALSPPVQTLIARLATLARSPGQAVVLVALTGCVASLIQWGMGVIVGALMAREMGRAFARAGRPVHYPLLGAAGYAGFTVWHGGLSGSAPLAVASPGHFLAPMIGVIPISVTLLSALNLAIVASLLLLIPLILWRLMPTRSEAMIPCVLPVTDPAALDAPEAPTRAHLTRWLESSRALNLALGALLAVVLWAHFREQGVAGWQLDSAILMCLSAGLIAHRSPLSYARALSEGVAGCSGIILQFPFYFGIVGMLKASGLIAQLASWSVALASPSTLAPLTFLSAGLVNLLVPSGGGQWAVQGPVIMEAAARLGVAPHKIVIALSHGDAWTNLLQPFWALPLLGIMGLRARDIIGYTALVMVLTGPVIMALLWML